jgi:antitoxin HicB
MTSKHKKNPHVGGSFDDFLAEEGILAVAESVAIKRVIAFQILQLMKDEAIKI